MRLAWERVLNNHPPKLVADGAERRWEPRRSVVSDSTLRGPSGIAQTVTVFDLSASGFSFAADTNLTVGSQVRIGIPGVGRAKAKVCRIEGSQHGCEFQIALTRAQLGAAFLSDTVVHGSFATELVGAHRFAEPEVGIWSGPIRASLIIGLPTLLWGTLALFL